MSLLLNKKIGCIGAGNMGGAILSRLAGKILVDNIEVVDSDKLKTGELKEKTGIKSVQSVEELVHASDIIIIAVKPKDMDPVLDQFGNFKIEKVIISIAAGISIEKIEKKLGRDKKVIRAMPNTPALIGEGMTVLSAGANADEISLEMAMEIFSLTGKVMVLSEDLMDAVTGLSGSGPAFVFTFIQALADGGVKMGIPRDKAVILAAQTVLGSARMLMENGEEPFTLRNRVASPGGTTIEGLHILENGGFSGIVMDAVEAAALKSKKLGA